MSQSSDPKKPLAAAGAPHPVCERLAYVCYLGLTAGGFGVAGLGLIIFLDLHDPRALCLGLAALCLAWWLHDVGHRQLHFQECEDSFHIAEDSSFPPADEAHERRADSLRVVLHDLDAQAQRCRRGEGDIWTVQDLRHRADHLLRADPRLRAEFDRELSQHPELGPR